VFRFLAGTDQRWQLTGIITEGLRLQKLERDQKELIKKLGLEYGKLQKREKLLDVVVRERTRELQVAYDRLKAASRQALLGLAEAIEAKDPYTKGHCGRTAVFAMALGREAQLSTEELEVLEFGAFLHDIGKIGVKDSVLLKPGALDDEEWKHMKVHSLRATSWKSSPSPSAHAEGFETGSTARTFPAHEGCRHRSAARGRRRRRRGRSGWR
jgi:response regulator RpfG family c-di-GMP phosphodiesterase